MHSMSLGFWCIQIRFSKEILVYTARWTSGISEEVYNRGGRPPGMNSSTYIHEDTNYRDSLTSRRAMTNVSNLHRSPLDLSSRQKTILITIC